MTSSSRSNITSIKRRQIITQYAKKTPVTIISKSSGVKESTIYGIIGRSKKLEKVRVHMDTTFDIALKWLISNRPARTRNIRYGLVTMIQAMVVTLKVISLLYSENPYKINNQSSSPRKEDIVKISDSTQPVYVDRDYVDYRKGSYQYLQAISALKKVLLTLS
jgi:hypothetical protein